MRAAHNAFATRGFTLIELMVAVVVAGILAAAAYPSMTSFVQRSRRADATAVLTAIVQAQERFRSNHNSYAEFVGVGMGENDVEIDASKSLKIDTGKITPHYALSLAGVGPSASFLGGYAVTAVAKSGSPQYRDTDCRKLIVTLQGAVLTYSAANAAGADSSAKCWPR